MKTLKLTKKDFKKTDNYWMDYIGKEDISNYDGNVEIEGGLGYVKFNSINIKGYLLARAGTGIKAGCGIKAGWDIEAGYGIEAGWGIEAGAGIKAGDGIKAGWGITCKKSLNIGLRIFAGLYLWRKPTKNELEITCGKLESGEVCYGDLIETGIEEDDDKVEITCEGKTVKISRESAIALNLTK